MPNLIDQIQTKLDQNPLLYVSKDAERGTGLEHVLTGMHHLFISDSYYADFFSEKNIPYLCYTNSVNSELAVKSSARLLSSPEVLEYIKQKNLTDAFVQTFKTSKAFEKARDSIGLRACNTPAVLNQEFEQKITQTRHLLQAHVSTPKMSVVTLGSHSYSELHAEYGDFVLQFNRGHSGNSTHFINTESEFNEIAEKFPKRDARISSKIDGIPYTLNACVTKQGIYMAGLSYQITGVKELTTDAGATIGNDFAWREGFGKNTEAEIISQVSKIGEHMASKGYLGLFGVDFLVQDEQIFVIEINARQTASVAFHTRIQLMHNQTPLSAMHLAAFMGLEIEDEPSDYNQKSLQPMQYAQIMKRADTDFMVGAEISTGIYRLQSDNSAIDRSSGQVVPGTVFLDEDQDKPMMLQHKSYAIEDTKDYPGVLLLTPKRNSKIGTGDEAIRMQLAQPLIQNGMVPGWVTETLNSFTRQLQ